MRKIFSRNILIYWLYCVALIHVTGGILLPWIGNIDLLENYHRSIEAGFWSGDVPTGARKLHVWWLSLFGPTIQTLGIWMFALIYIGEKYRISFAWLAILIGFVVWAPQDILISLRVNAFKHVWLDLVVLIVVLPPLVRLWLLDKNN
ncbi:MAG: cell division protein [Chitinophagaceae bacterium]|nr:MAG: cell division protein [Chitinophagaceae bacterium]